MAADGAAAAAAVMVENHQRLGASEAEVDAGVRQVAGGAAAAAVAKLESQGRGSVRPAVRASIVQAANDAAESASFRIRAARKQTLQLPCSKVRSSVRCAAADAAPAAIVAFADKEGEIPEDVRQLLQTAVDLISAAAIKQLEAQTGQPAPAQFSCSVRSAAAAAATGAATSGAGPVSVEVAVSAAARAAIANVEERAPLSEEARDRIRQAGEVATMGFAGSDEVAN